MSYQSFEDIVNETIQDESPPADIENSNKLTCQICFDEENIVDINNLDNVRKNCKCVSYCHEKCIMKWYKQNKLCIICRSPIEIVVTDENTSSIQSNITMHRYNRQSINCMYIKNCLINLFILTFFSFCFLIFFGSPFPKKNED